MLKGLKFIKELGAGSNALADLYEDRSGNNLVLRTSVLPFNFVFINEEGNYQILYRNSYTEITYPIIQELQFFNLVANMQHEESKYFIKLIRYDVTKSPDKEGNQVKYNINRLKSDNSIAHNTEINKRIYLRQLIEYAGIALLDAIKDLSIKEIENAFDSMLKINNITRKYKWHIWDFHIGNFCISPNGNVKLIDVSSVADMKESYKTGGISSLKNNYQSNYNIINLLSIACGISEFKYKYGIPYMSETAIAELLQNIAKSKKFPQIVSIVTNFYKNADYKNYVIYAMKDIKKGNYLIDYIDLGYMMDILLCVLDNKHYMDFWKLKIETAEKIKPLTSTAYISKLLKLIVEK